MDGVYREYYGLVLEGGSSPEEVVADMLEVDDAEIAEAIVEHLHRLEFSDVADGADPLYAIGSGYEMRELYAWELQYTWEEFCRRVQFGQRYFDATAKSMLDDILTPIRDLEELGVRAPVISLQPRDGTLIYRARAASNRVHAKKLMANPAKELTAPHPRRGRSGRLNAMGIPVFYGAFSRRTCIAEVRPPVGSFVVTAAFELTRPVRLLDLTAFEHTWPLRSMFDPSFGDDMARWHFLVDFHRLITEPVHPADEALEYVPTQAVADYIYFELGFQGVIYRSAQEDSDPWEQEPFSDQNVAILRMATPEELGEPTSFEILLDSTASIPLVPGTQAAPGPPGEGEEPPLLEYVADSVELYVIRGVELDAAREWQLE